MNIVIAVHHFPPRYKGGAELRAFRTANWLQAQGHKVLVICVEAIDDQHRNGLVYSDEMYDGLHVHRLRFNLAESPDPFLWKYNNPWIGEHFNAYLTELKPQVLHVISGYLISSSPLVAAMNLGIATVVSLTDFWFICPRITLLRSNGQLCTPPFKAATCAQCLGEEQRRYRILGQIAPELMRTYWNQQTHHIGRIENRTRYLIETLNHVNAIISPSQFLRNLFIETGIEPERIIFSRQGRDFPKLNPKTLKKTSASHLRIGYMGQIAPHKGIHVLFKAIQKLPGAAIAVKAYGDISKFPDYTKQLQRMTRQDSRLNLAGVYERTEVSNVLKDIDIVIVPSVWYENSPNTILESFAHQTPVIASNLGGMAELVEHGVNGLLFKTGDTIDLAAKFKTLLDNPNLLSQLRRGIKPVKSVAEEMRELSQIYQRSIQS